MTDDVDKLPEPEGFNLREVVLFITAAVLLFVVFRFIDWQFGVRVHTAVLVGFWVVIIGLRVWLRRE